MAQVDSILQSESPFDNFLILELKNTPTSNDNNSNYFSNTNQYLKSKPFYNFSITQQAPSKDFQLQKESVVDTTETEDERLSLDDLDFQPDVKEMNETIEESFENDDQRLSLDDLEIHPELEDIDNVIEDSLDDDQRLSIDDLEVHQEIFQDIDLSEEEIDKVIDDSLDDDQQLSHDDLEVHPEVQEIDLTEDEIDSALNDSLSDIDDKLTIDDLFDSKDLDLTTSQDISLRNELHQHAKQLGTLDIDWDMEGNMIQPSDKSIQEEFNQKEHVSKKLFTYEEDSDSENLDQQELKDILVYLDQLFGQLPDNAIKDFAQSPYYELYNNLLDKLKI